jgi:hypothetical protein
MKLPNPDELRQTAVQFLIEGNEYNEATLLSSCSLEIGELRYVRGSVNEIDITLRCSRKIFEQLRTVEVNGWDEEPPLKLHLKRAVLAALPSGYGIANFDARAAAWTEVPEDLPNDVKEILNAALKDHKSKTVDANSEAAKNYLFVPLIRQESGRGLFRLVQGSDGIIPDYPESLTAEQVEAVGFVLDYLTDYNDVHNDLDPSQTLKCEREVSEKLGELDKLGLWVFCGNYKAKQVFKNGNSMVSPIAVVVVARNNDPRIRRESDGTILIKAAIPKRGSPFMDAGPAKPEAGAEAKPPAETPEVQTVNRPKYLMQKAGSHWEIVFDGGKLFHLEHTLGAQYLDYLLHHPSEVISAYELELVVQPEKGKVRGRDSIQSNSDAAATKDYLRELNDLRAERESAVEVSNHAEVDRLDHEIEPLEAALGANGHAADAGERARGNVSKAIAAVRKKLLKRDTSEKAFAQHIGQFISTGYKCIYNRPKEEKWF